MAWSEMCDTLRSFFASARQWHLLSSFGRTDDQRQTLKVESAEPRVDSMHINDPASFDLVVGLIPRIRKDVRVIYIRCSAMIHRSQVLEP